MLEQKFPRVSGYFEEQLTLRQFEKKKSLGSGTFGQVGLYRHIATGKDYAIKKISLNVQSKKITRQQLESLTKKELQILYKIDNIHILKLLDHFYEKDEVYLITEFIQGNNLYDIYLKPKKRPSLEIIADIIYQICEGLEQLHLNHIIHRDIKLQNVMQSNKIIKIVDLGCSNFYGETISRHTMIGTKFYWSPELLTQEEQNDRLDVWCVGVILYELMFLDQPFNTADIQKKIRVNFDGCRKFSTRFLLMPNCSLNYQICLMEFSPIKIQELVHLKQCNILGLEVEFDQFRTSKELANKEDSILTIFQLDRNKRVQFYHYKGNLRQQKKCLVAQLANYLSLEYAQGIQKIIKEKMNNIYKHNYYQNYEKTSTLNFSRAVHQLLNCLVSKFFVSCTPILLLHKIVINFFSFTFAYSIYFYCISNIPSKLQTPLFFIVSSDYN